GGNLFLDVSSESNSGRRDRHSPTGLHKLSHFGVDILGAVGKEQLTVSAIRRLNHKHPELRHYRIAQRLTELSRHFSRLPRHREPACCLPQSVVVANAPSQEGPVHQPL